MGATLSQQNALPCFEVRALRRFRYLAP